MNRSIPIASGVLVVFAILTLGVLLSGYTNQNHVIKIPPMEHIGEVESLDAPPMEHIKEVKSLEAHLASLEKTVTDALNRLSKKVEQKHSTSSESNDYRHAIIWDPKPPMDSFRAPDSVSKFRLIPCYGNPTLNQEPARTSAHICSGRDFTKSKIPNSDQHAHCFFKYLCVAPGKGPRPAHFRTRGHFDWYYLYDKIAPPDSVNFTLGVGPHMVDHKVLIAPKLVLKNDFRKEFPQVRVEPSLAHIFYEYNGENFGHMLTDVIMPIYSIMAGFDQLNHDIQLVRFQMTHDLGFSCDYQRNPNWGDPRWIPDRVVVPRADKMCQKMYNMFTPAITSRPILLMESLFNETKTPICFEKLLVGTPMLSDDCMEGGHGRNLNQYSNCMTGRMEQMWKFRSWIKSHLGVDDEPPEEHHIVIWQRGDNKRLLKDLDKLADKLKGKFNVKATIIDFATISLQDQLKLIGSATVHITGPGGGSFISFFLPRGATSVRLYSQEYGMEFHFFNYLGYIHADYRHAPGGNIDQDDVANLVELALDRFDKFAGYNLPRNAN